MLRAFVNCAMMLKKHLSFFYFQWQKVDQVRSEYLRSYLNWLYNWQLKSSRRSHALKGSHSMGDGWIFLKPRCDDSFKKVLSNEPNFGRIHLAGQYLKLKHRYCTSSVITDIWEVGKDRLSMRNLSNSANSPCDIWSVGKEPTAMFEFSTWHASFVDFFKRLRHYTVIGNQLFISNNRNRVRWVVLGLLQDGACNKFLENLSENTLKGDLSNVTTFSFNPPLFSLVDIDTFNDQKLKTIYSWEFFLLNCSLVFTYP